jgi:hypothetical protein
MRAAPLGMSMSILEAQERKRAREVYTASHLLEPGCLSLETASRDHEWQLGDAKEGGYNEEVGLPLDAPAIRLSPAASLFFDESIVAPPPILVIYQLSPRAPHPLGLGGTRVASTGSSQRAKAAPFCLLAPRSCDSRGFVTNQSASLPQAPDEQIQKTPTQPHQQQSREAGARAARGHQSRVFDDHRLHPPTSASTSRRASGCPSIRRLRRRTGSRFVVPKTRRARPSLPVPSFQFLPVCITSPPQLNVSNAPPSESANMSWRARRYDLSQRQLVLLRESQQRQRYLYHRRMSSVHPRRVSPSLYYLHAANKDWRWGDARNSTITLPSEEIGSFHPDCHSSAHT